MTNLPNQRNSNFSANQPKETNILIYRPASKSGAIESKFQIKKITQYLPEVFFLSESFSFVSTMKRQGIWQLQPKMLFVQSKVEEGIQTVVRDKFSLAA